LGLLLKILGHEVKLAHDGPSAVATVIAFAPEFALVDIGIPGFNGYEVAKRIREVSHLKNTLLVAQTGWGQDEDRRRSEEAGFNQHWVKPIDMARLRELIRSMD
jgi:CheY-like chemotaxis protein